MPSSARREHARSAIFAAPMFEENARISGTLSQRRLA
jgi:hypothetical protein